MFPLTVRGSIPITSDRPPGEMQKLAIQTVQVMLYEAYVKDIWTEQNEIQFTVGLFGPRSRWHCLARFDFGRIWVECENTGILVRFKLRALRGTAMTMLVIVVPILGWLGASKNAPVDQTFPIAVWIGFWLVLHCGGLLIAKLRVREWLKKGIAANPKPTPKTLLNA